MWMWKKALFGQRRYQTQVPRIVGNNMTIIHVDTTIRRKKLDRACDGRKWPAVGSIGGKNVW